MVVHVDQYVIGEALSECSSKKFYGLVFPSELRGDPGLPKPGSATRIGQDEYLQPA